MGSLHNPFTFQTAVNLIVSGKVRIDLLNPIPMSLENLPGLLNGSNSSSAIKHQISPNSLIWSIFRHAFGSSLRIKHKNYNISEAKIPLITLWVSWLLRPEKHGRRLSSRPANLKLVSVSTSRVYLLFLKSTAGRHVECKCLTGCFQGMFQVTRTYPFRRKEVTKRVSICLGRDQVNFEFSNQSKGGNNEIFN